MSKPKKPLNTKQKQRRFRTIQYSCVAGEFISTLTPYIVIGAINYDEYFVQTGAESWKISLGGILAMCVMGIATTLVARKKEDKSFTNGFIALILGWFTVAFIMYLLSAIIQDIAMIMLCGGVGLLGALGLDITSGVYKKKADKYKAFIEDNEMRQSAIDMEAEYQAELESAKNRRKGLM